MLFSVTVGVKRLTLVCSYHLAWLEDSLKGPWWIWDRLKTGMSSEGKDRLSLLESRSKKEIGWATFLRIHATSFDIYNNLHGVRLRDTSKHWRYVVYWVYVIFSSLLCFEEQPWATRKGRLFSFGYLLWNGWLWFGCAGCDHFDNSVAGLRPYPCDQCQYRAATSSNLKRHQEIHRDIRNHNCHLCNLNFRQKIHLERHIKYRHEVSAVCLASSFLPSFLLPFLSVLCQHEVSAVCLVSTWGQRRLSCVSMRTVPSVLCQHEDSAVCLVSTWGQRRLSCVNMRSAPSVLCQHEVSAVCLVSRLSLIHIWRCRRWP